MLKGYVVGGDEQRNDNISPHYHINVSDNDNTWTVPVNIRSKYKPYNLLFYLATDFDHPVLDDIEGFDPGYYEKKDNPKISIDYLRSELFNLEKFKPVIYDKDGKDNDLNDYFEFHIEKAKKDKAQIYVFGERINNKRILHDVHMNQGNKKGSHDKDNGAYQDGAIFIKFKTAWTAIFTAFQSQLIPTDNNGHPLPSAKPIFKPKDNNGNPSDVKPEILQHDIVIIGAEINPVGNDVSKEIVYLFNKSLNDISLTGWFLEDKNNKKAALDHLEIAKRSSLAVNLDGKGTQLSNKGGTISLYDQNNIKNHGVSYTKKETPEEGKVLIFKNG